MGHLHPRRLALNPALPAELAEKLADEAEWVAHAAAGSPFLPRQEMERLLALTGL
jgi:hypothetical protein